VYNAKGFSQQEVDIALLAWRLGGLRLLHALGQKEGYPSAYTIAQNTPLQRFTLSTTGHSDEALKANVEAAYPNGDLRPKVLEVDEIAAEPTPRYCSR
jgi:hypothetical protein